MSRLGPLGTSLPAERSKRAQAFAYTVSIICTDVFPQNTFKDEVVRGNSELLATSLYPPWLSLCVFSVPKGFQVGIAKGVGCCHCILPHSSCIVEYAVTTSHHKYFPPEMKQ